MSDATQELKDVSEDSKEFFDCMLTQMNWTELLLEDQDVLGTQRLRRKMVE